MTQRPVPLVAALSGLASVVLLFAGQGLSGGGSSPDLTKSRAAHASWIAQQHPTTAGYAGDILELVGILLLIVFAATLWSVLRAGDEGGIFAGTAFGAGIASAAVKLASVPAAFAVYWRADQGWDPQVVTALFDMNDAAFVLTWGIDAVMLGAAACVILRSGVLPRWLGWLAAVAGTISLVTMPVAMKVPPLGILLTFVWLVGTSIVLTRRSLRGTPRSAVATA
jgi:Domain of unknown function (DUF4386)